MDNLTVLDAPLCPSLNGAIHRMAKKYVSEYRFNEDAPGSFRELCNLLDAGETLVVYSGGSNNTIFCDPATNYAFRAWHDWCHWQTGYDFSLVGEMFTCNVQIQHLVIEYTPGEVTVWLPYLTAEVIGQRLYFERYREYIVDQKAFVLAYIEDSRSALARKW